MPEDRTRHKLEQFNVNMCNFLFMLVYKWKVRPNTTQNSATVV